MMINGVNAQPQTYQTGYGGHPQPQPQAGYAGHLLPQPQAPPHPGYMGYPPPHPGYMGYPPPHPGYMGYPPPHNPGYMGYPPPHPGYMGYPPPQPFYGRYPPHPPTQMQQTPMFGAMGLGLGLLGADVGGMLIANTISDVVSGFFDGGGI